MTTDETKLPPHRRRRAPKRQARRRDLQLPLRADGRTHQAAVDGRDDRTGDLGRLPLVSRQSARCGLLPPLACVPQELGHAVGAQGDAPLRPDQLVPRRRPRRGERAGRTAPLRPQWRRAWCELPHLPAQEQLRLPLGHDGRPERSSHSTPMPNRWTATCATPASFARTSTSTTRWRRRSATRRAR